MADDLKAKGNAAFSSGSYQEAIDLFSQAIQLSPDNHVLYSNRSAAYASLQEFSKALEDGKKAVSLKPDWPKGYSRVGAAYHGLGEYEEAVKAYEDGLKHNPGNAQLMEGLKSAQQEASRARGPPGGGLFGPQMLSQLALNPETRPWLQDPSFLAMMRDLQTNPQAMTKYMSDPRFLKVLEVAMGVKVQTASPGEEPMETEEDAPEPAAPVANGTAAARKTDAMEVETPASTADAPPDVDDSVMQANKEKELGNAAYKAKKFEEALQHYDKALELHFDVSFLTNKAAVYLEMAEYDECIKTCDEAVEKGRELRADNKVIGRALTRKANALVKSNRLEEAVQVYNKALVEHRNADTLKRLNEAEKALKDQKEASYINLDVCNEEKEKGNEAFKKQQFPEAVKHYSEALKRGPPKVNTEAYKLYSNRAACYTKLGALPEALKDADECIALAPSFAKGYSRKGAVQFLMKEYEKSLATYRAGLEHDPENEELKDGVMRSIQQIQRFATGDVSEDELKQRQARAMQDPEIQGIMTDPIMQQVLKDLSENPKSAQHHLRNAAISQKLNRLVQAGIVRLG